MVITHPHDFAASFSPRYPAPHDALRPLHGVPNASGPHDGATKGPHRQEDFRALSPVLDTRSAGPLRSSYAPEHAHLPLLASSYAQVPAPHLDSYYMQHSYAFPPVNPSYDIPRASSISSQPAHHSSSPLFLSPIPGSQMAADNHRPLTIPSLLPSPQEEQGQGRVVPVLPLLQAGEQPHSAVASEPAGPSHAHTRGPVKKEASTVVIACRQCRARKIRCDSIRPSCNSCLRRSNECQYDAVPKRRGPDKRPGTRQRSCKKRPADGSPPKKKPKRNVSDEGMDVRATTKENLGLKLDVACLERRASNTHLTDMSSTPLETMSNHIRGSPSSALSPSTTVSLHASGSSLVGSPDAFSMRIPRFPESVSPSRGTWEQIPPLVDHRRMMLHDGVESIVIPSPHHFSSSMGTRHHSADILHVVSPSGGHFSHAGWWEDLLDTYSSNREQSKREIENDLSFLFSSSNYWLFFINEDLFFQSLADEAGRRTMQPALVLGGLALATLMRSSELGYGKVGRERALWLRDMAQSRLDSSWQESIIDTPLAAAAMTLAIFETSAHPEHTPERACSALIRLDDVIRALALTTIDARDPEASIFMPRSVPSVQKTYQSFGDSRCRCGPPVHMPSLLGRDSDQMALPGWDPSSSVEEIRQEETRRLCWSALTLAATHTAHCTAFQTEPLDLFLTKPENYALLFPGENAHRSDTIDPPKESVWALYCRSMLLWNGCLQFKNAHSTDSEKAEFAFHAFMETRDIEDALDAHVCTSNAHIMHLAREYITNTRIAITREFRRLCHLDNAKPERHQAEEWLASQTAIAESFQFDIRNTRDPRVLSLTRRPFYVWWFMSQVTISMSVWANERSLVQALILCKAYLTPLDFLTALWPCPAQRERYLQLRQELADNCMKAGLSPPPPPDFTLPSVHIYSP